MSSAAAFADRDLRILAGYRAGATLPELHLAEEVAPQVVRRVLRAAGIAVDGRRAVLPPSAAEHLADLAWLAAEYAAKAAPQITEELGCSERMVYRALEAAGIARRTREECVPKARGLEPWLPEKVDQVLECYAAGKSVQAVADELGLSHERVYKLLRARTLSDGSGVLRSRDEARQLVSARRWREAGQVKPDRSEREAEVLMRYAAGESGGAIAQALGLTQKIVYGLFRREGVLRSHKEAAEIRAKAKLGPEAKPESVQKEPPEIMPAEMAEQALERYAAGEPPRAIGRTLGVQAGRVYQLLKERGVLRSRSEARKVMHARRRAIGAQ